MSTILKIKRSSAAQLAAPTALGQGELAYGEGTVAYVDAQNQTVQSSGKLFIGRGTETEGEAAAIDIIGGKYFTDLLDHGHGTVTANSAVIVDSSNKVDLWNVDNITLNGNTISTTNSNGDLTVDTNGTGDVIVAGSNTVGDNLFKITDGTADRFVVDSFSGALDITTPALSAADTVLNISSTWNNPDNVFKGIDFDVTDTESSDDSRLLELSVGGATKFDVDKAGNVSLSGTVDGRDIATDGAKLDGIEAGATADQTAAEIRALVESATDSNVFTDADHSKLDGIEAGATADQTAAEILTALLTVDGHTSGLDADLLDGVEAENFLRSDENDTMSGNLTFADNKKAIFGTGLEIFYNSTTNNSVIKEIGSGVLNIGADDNVNITNSAGSEFKAKFITDGGVELYYDNVKKFTTTVSGIGVFGTKLETSESTFELLETNATLVKAFGTAETIRIGKSGDYTTTLASGTLVGTETTQNVFNTTATTVNAFGAAESLNIGASGAHTTTLGSGTLVGTETTQNVFNTTATTVNAFGAATTLNIGSSSTDLNICGLNIVGSTISTDNPFDQTITIDPYPDGGDAGGDVIIRGNLQVSGTTMTINSTDVSVNDPVFTIGDTVTEKTAIDSAAVNTTSLVVDNPSGVVKDATIIGAGIASNTTISNVRVGFWVTSVLSTTPNAGDNIYFYDGTSFSLLGTYVSETVVNQQSGLTELVIDLADNISTRADNFYYGKFLTTDSSGTPSNSVSITKIDEKVFRTTTLTISSATITSVTAGTALTISQASDDNLDRGIQFKYLKSNAAKVGFFGYDDSTEYFTFIPDATNNSNLFSGTKGEAWFKTVKLDDGVVSGIPYFDANKKLNSTVAAGSADATTSNQILTVNGSGVPVWTTTIDGGTY